MTSRLASALVCLLSLPLALAHAQQSDSSAMDRITKAPFGQTSDGQAVDLYTITNANGLEMQVTNYGGLITSLRVPDKEGNLGDVALGYDALDGYLEQNPFFGALVGRYGNRIAGAQFTLDDSTYTLAANNGPNHIHGGVKGFDKRVWQAEPFEDETGGRARFDVHQPGRRRGVPRHAGDARHLHTHRPERARLRLPRHPPTRPRPST